MSEKDIAYQDINAQTINRWVEEGWEWGVSIDHVAFVNAQRDQWSVLLTPTKPVPREWLGDIRGKSLLGLASGGGQQIPLFTAAGAICTVLDYSENQLKSEELVAKREGYPVTIICADMSKPLPFDDASFDIIFHPVSNCYIEKVEPVFLECYRVLKPGGILLCGLDIGINYAVDDQEERIVNPLPFNPLTNEENRRQCEREDSGYQFSHTIGEQIGGQLKAGFTLTHIDDDTNGEGRLHQFNIPSFLMTRAVKQ